MEVCEGHVGGSDGGDELCGGADREVEGGG
jgi:hypothetical protein